MTDTHIDEETGVETTGHTWDGIEELNNPLPRWWLWTFYATCVWGLIYTLLWPAWPLVNQATGGFLGWSSRGEVAEAIAANEAAQADIRAQLVATELTAIADDPALQSYAVNAGAAVFRTWCAQCHGSGAAGATGYPNLLDDDWLWGGTMDQIHHTISHGIRNEDDPDAHYSAMPAFGEILEEDEITSLVAQVQHMSTGASVETGPAPDLYRDNCAACHGDTGEGDRTQGAPNLIDAIWLYGGDAEALTQTITNARFGVMPPWADRLGEANTRAVTAYIHQLGGGE